MHGPALAKAPDDAKSHKKDKAMAQGELRIADRPLPSKGNSGAVSGRCVPRPAVAGTHTSFRWRRPSCVAEQQPRKAKPKQSLHSRKIGPRAGVGESNTRGFGRPRRVVYGDDCVVWWWCMLNCALAFLGEPLSRVADSDETCTVAPMASHAMRGIM